LQEFAGDDARVLQFPADLLRDVHIVDTPGTNAVLLRHEAITRDFIPRSDLVIFVTSADRPFSESERAFLEQIRDWGKKVIVALNKIDILQSPEEQHEVQTFVTDQAGRLLGFEPEVFALSARQARQGESGPGAEGFAQFRRHLLDTLSETNRVRLKLLNPLGVALRVAQDEFERLQARAGILRADVEALSKVERHLELYQTDTEQEFERHLARIEAELLEMQLRGEAFIDDRMRLLNLRQMLNAGSMRQAFEEEVVGQAPERVEGFVREIIDWMVERELRQWRLMADELSRRKETEALVDAAREAAGGFAYNRRQLLESLGARTERVIDDYDRSTEAARLASSVQESIAVVGILELGAVGLGLLLKALMVGAAADLSGLLAFSMLGALGLAILPYRRGAAKKELRQKMSAMRQRLKEVLEESFGREMEQARGRLHESIAPYQRFVRQEQSRMEKVESGVGEIIARLKVLQAEVESADTTA
jgi:hypothetical protein